MPTGNRLTATHQKPMVRPTQPPPPPVGRAVTWTWIAVGVGVVLIAALAYLLMV